MLRKLFLDHPEEMGETYAEHFGIASGVGRELIVAGLGSLLHALVPALCKTTGSTAIARLHRRIVAQREAKRLATVEAATVEWTI